MRVVWLFVVLLIVSSSVGISIRSYQKAEKATGSFDREMYLRISTEEDLQSAKDKIKALEQQLTLEKKTIKELKDQLDGAQVINKELRARLDKAAELQGTLEGKIKELEILSSAL